MNTVKRYALYAAVAGIAAVGFVGPAWSGPKDAMDVLDLADGTRSSLIAERATVTQLVAMPTVYGLSTNCQSGEWAIIDLRQMSSPGSSDIIAVDTARTYTAMKAKADERAHRVPKKVTERIPLPAIRAQS